MVERKLIIKKHTPDTKTIDIQVPEDYTDGFANTIRMIEQVSWAYSLLNLASIYVKMSKAEAADIVAKHIDQLWEEIFPDET